MVYPMAPWPVQNKHFSFLTFSILFFLAIFYFTRHILEPNLSNYRHLWLQTLPLSSIFSKRPSLPNPIYQTTYQPLPSPSSSEGPIVSLSPHEAPHSQISEEGFSHSAVNGSQASDISKEEDGVVNKKRESSSVGLGSTETWQKCDIYDGTWVRDDGYPLYQPGSCPYVDDAYNCNANGRRDLDYMKWRWKPHGCEIPRFNATDFLERLRGKRLMLVGDSMNRNQFESMLCLLHEALPNKSRMYETRGYKITKGRGYFIFRFEDYDCTVEFVRSHFLVKEGTHLTSKGKSRPNLSIDRIDKSANRWKHADILIFNTGHWWTHGKTARGIDYYQEGDYIHPQFDALEAFKKSMRTWGRWIEKNTNPAKNLVFYRGYSTAHFRGGDWDSGGTCNGETEPIVTGPILDNYPVKMKILEEVMQEIRTPVILLNVTKLTNFRKDGHPSFYGKKFTEGRKLSSKAQDCSHWCLPGIPDAWNELIYANLVMRKLPWESGIKKSIQTLTTR